MEDLEKLQTEIANLKNENKSLKDEIERLKSGKFDAGAYIERLKAQAERDKAATEELIKRFQ